MSTLGVAKIRTNADHEKLFPKPVVRAALWRAGYACERCANTTRLGVFMRQISEKGVDQRVSNLVVLDVVCRHWLLANPRHANRTGFGALSTTADPAGILMDVKDRGRVLLTDTGEYKTPLSIAQAAEMRRSA